MSYWQLSHEPNYDAMWQAYCEEHDRWERKGHDDAVAGIYDPPQGGEERDWYLTGVYLTYNFFRPNPDEAQYADTDILF